MVRRNELACRDEWSRSLWQPVGEPNVNGDEPFQRPLLIGPLPPTRPQNLRTLLGEDATCAASPDGEDVLLSEARIVSEAHVPWDPSERPFSTGGFDPRTAIFRAREAYRERLRAKAVADRQSDGAQAPSAEGFSIGVPDLEPDLLPARVSKVEAAPGQTGLASREELDPTPELDESQVDPAGSKFPDRNKEFSPWAELPERRPEAPGQARRHESNDDDPGMEKRSVSLKDEQPNVAAATEQARDDARFASQPGVEAEEEPLPDWFRTDLPRTCRTCRDYRPSVDGQRGWCANAWAFTHRRLVHEDDVVPCQSATGDWWAPVDDVWLVAADVSSHGRATPLLDRLTGKIDPQRRRS